jgi:hypothetical protein
MRERLIFLSYSRRDSGLVRKFEAIVRAVGRTPWRDERDISPGDVWRFAIARSIQECERMLVFWCRHARDSREVKKEYLSAFDAAKPLVPVRLDRSRLLPPLTGYQELDLGPWFWVVHEILLWDGRILGAGLILLVIGAFCALL